MLLAGAHAVPAAEEVWIAPTSGTWSNPGNWLDGTAPDPSGAPDLTLRFGGPGLGFREAVNDLSEGFRLNQILLDSSRTGMFSITGKSLQLSGIDPAITVRGRAMTTISSPLSLDSASGTVTVSNSGSENLLLSGVISEVNGPQSLTVNATSTAAQPGTLTLSGANTFTGGVTLLGGRLAVGDKEALGTGTLTANGGTLQLNSALTVSNGILLRGHLAITTVAGGTLSGPISSSTPDAGLILRNNNTTLSLTASSTYTGATVIDYTPLPNSNFTSGTLRVTGGGSIAASSAIEVRAEGKLQIDAVNGGSNRIGDDTPVTLRNGQLTFAGVPGTEAQTESIGALRSSGYSTISLLPASGGGSLRLTAASLGRVDRGTFIFSGPSLGGAFANGSSNILITSQPAGLAGGAGTGPQTSILPYAVNGANFVTWNAETGVRPLDLVTDYVASIAGAGATSNLRLATSTAHSGTITINSLLLAASSLSGAGTISVASGAILIPDTTTATITNALNFGAAEANIFALGNLTLTGTLVGSNGLTKSGYGSLTLLGTNNISGPLTVNSGIVAFSSAARLGSDTSPIVFGGTGAGLHYTGSTPLTLNRDIHLSTGTGRFLVNSENARVDLAGSITGAGGLFIAKIAQGSPGIVALGGANTYTGPTQVRAGINLMIYSDASLGDGGALELFSRSILTLAGNWETTRPVALVPSVVSGPPVTIDTAQFDATLKGPVSGSAAGLTKLGTGTLQLQADSRSVRGTVSLNSGSIALSGLGAMGPHRWNLAPGTRLVIDNTSAALSNRVGTGGIVTSVQLEAAGFELRGNSDVAVQESLTFAVRGVSTVTLASSGNSPVTLNIAGLSHLPAGFHTRTPETGTALLIRSSNLGAGPEGAFSRVTVGSVQPRPGSPLGYGFVPNVYLADPVNDRLTSLGFYDSSSDSAGEIGFRPLRPGEYETGSIRNPANGGSTSASAHFLAGPGVLTHGAENAVTTLTLQPGGNVTLSNNQQLGIASGTVLALSGGVASTINGGTIDLGAHRAAVYTGGDLVIGSNISGTGTLIKAGPGVLTFGGIVTPTGGVEIDEGSLNLSAGAAVTGVVGLNMGTTIQLVGSASVGALTGPGSLDLGSSTLTVGGVEGEFTLSGNIVGTGGLVIKGSATGNQTHLFSGTNPFSGGIVLQSGRLSWSQSTSLGSAPITAQGGALYGMRVGSNAPPVLSNPITANADLVIEGESTVTLGPSAIISGTQGLELRDRSSVVIQSASVYGGETRSVYSATAFTSPLGTLTVSGASGSIAGSSSIRIGPSGTLLLDNSTAFTGGEAGRVGDATSIHLQSADLRLTGLLSATTIEKVGTLSAGGFSSVTIVPSGGSTWLEATSLARIDRGTFLFRVGGNSGQLLFTNAPTDLIGGAGTGPNVSILPYAIGDASTLANGSGFVTFDPSTGIRLLDVATEYTANLLGAAPTHNVRLAEDVTNNASLIVNALLLHPLNVQTIDGTGSLQITSGALLKTGNTDSTLLNDLVFGGAEAQMFVTGNSTAHTTTLTLKGTISGSGGLTKSGDDTLVLMGANTFTGPLTINSGVLEFHTGANLGSDTSPIRVMGRNLGTGIRYGGATPGQLLRDIIVTDGLLELSTHSDLRILGTVSGTGGLLISRYLTFPEPEVSVFLDGINTYEGDTVIKGNLQFASDAALGKDGRVINTKLIRLAGPWTTAREIETLNGVLDTNGHDATWNGPLTGGLLQKTGTGTLTINNASAYTGTLEISGGTVAANGPMASGGTLTAGIAGTLSGTGDLKRAATIAGTLAPGNQGPGTLSVDTLTFSDGATLALELASADRFDQVIVADKVTLNGTVALSLALSFDPIDHIDSFQIVTNLGTSSISGTGAARFAFGGQLLAEGDEFLVGAQEFRISYAGGTGNDVVLHAIPEPASAPLLFGGSLLLLLRRKPRERRTANLR